LFIVCFVLFGLFCYFVFLTNYKKNEQSLMNTKEAISRLFSIQISYDVFHDDFDDLFFGSLEFVFVCCIFVCVCVVILLC